MENAVYNSYLFKALDAYPYELQEAIEALNYALSYNPKSAQALCLMGKIYAEQLGDLETAKEYFAEAMASNFEVVTIYPDYIYCLLLNENYEEAEKLITFAFTVKGSCKTSLYSLKGQLYERQGRYKEAIKTFKKGKRYSYSSDWIRFMNDAIERVGQKLPKKKRKKKSAK